MSLPPLESISNSHFCMSGDVTIHDGAAIASGVILQADPGSRIIIAAGVCIGMGAILHAHQGTLEVEIGVTVGAGVLVVGKGKIGANACIGPATTIWNSSVPSGQVVPSGSLLGDTGRQAVQVTASAEESLNGQSPATTETSADVPPVEATSTSSEPEIDPASIMPPTSSPEAPPVGVPVYGQANLNRLLGTLFPYNRSFKHPNEDG